MPNRTTHAITTPTSSSTHMSQMTRHQTESEIVEIPMFTQKRFLLKQFPLDHKSILFQIKQKIMQCASETITLTLTVGSSELKKCIKWTSDTIFLGVRSHLSQFTAMSSHCDIILHKFQGLVWDHLNGMHLTRSRLKAAHRQECALNPPRQLAGWSLTGSYDK